MKRLTRRAITLTTLSLLLACGGDDGGGFDFMSGTQGTGIGPGTGGGTAEASGGSGSGSGDTTGAPVDTGDSGPAPGSTGSETGGSETEDLPTVPCTAIDVVFVVDNSDTMIEEQLRLVGTASAWIDQVNGQTPSVIDDVRVGVITTDNPIFVQSDGAGMACGPYASGEPWMTLGPTLATELGCALSQGVAGDPDERPMDMIQEALSDDNLAPGGAHAGFLRDDALLLIVLLTDEEDDLERDTQWGSEGDPPDWIDAIAAKKEGHLGNVVVVSLVGHEKPNACPAFQWDGVDGAEIAPRLIELTDAFPQGAVGDICQAEYATFLFGIVPGVAAACNGFTP